MQLGRWGPKESMGLFPAERLQTGCEMGVVGFPLGHIGIRLAGVTGRGGLRGAFVEPEATTGTWGSKADILVPGLSAPEASRN